MARIPRITVCIPTYNRSEYLALALGSVLTQTLQDFEIIVYDDASTDDTEQAVLSFGDGRIRYFRQEKNVGIAENRNSCLRSAKGDYIAWLDSDDLLLQEMLERQSAVLDGNPGVGLVHGGFEVIDANGRRLPEWGPPFEHDAIERAADAFRELVLVNDITTSTVMVRRECYASTGPYATDIGRSGTDWEMWLRIALQADVAYTAALVARYRVHEGSISAETAKADGRVRRDVAVIDRVFDRNRASIPEAAAVERLARAALAARAIIESREMFIRGRRSAALRLALTSFTQAPLLQRSWHAWALLWSVARGAEYAEHRHSRALLGLLYCLLKGARYGERIRRVALVDSAWEQTLRCIAGIVRKVVPRKAGLVSVDKSDPTLLHLSGRKGWHFPDWRTHVEGYPPDSVAAIRQLEELRCRGAAYVVFPRVSFWWLEHYRELAGYLEAHGDRLWSDEQCIIYRY